MKIKKNFFLNNPNENNAFYLSIFLLPSAPFISSIILLFIGINLSLKDRRYFSDKWNIPLFFSALLMIFSCLSNFISRPIIYDQPNELNLIWIGILNWIPYFYFFWTFQKFLDSSILRKNTVINLINGSIPLLLTIIGQYWFGWHGPFKALNGLLIWFQRPIIPEGGVSGLFNNQNHAGSWLVIIFPFLIACMNQISHSKLKKFVVSFLISLVGIQFKISFDFELSAITVCKSPFLLLTNS